MLYNTTALHQGIGGAFHIGIYAHTASSHRSNELTNVTTDPTMPASGASQETESNNNPSTVILGTNSAATTLAIGVLSPITPEK